MCDTGEIKYDENQEAAIKWLERYVNEQVYAHRSDLKRFKHAISQLSNEDKSLKSKAWAKANQEFKNIHDIKSIYLWGDPGCGKSFIIETLFKSFQLDPKTQCFLHYQEFMLKVHQREHKINQKLKGKTGDTISYVGNEFAADLLVLCIDEF